MRPSPWPTCPVPRPSCWTSVSPPPSCRWCSDGSTRPWTCTCTLTSGCRSECGQTPTTSTGRPAAGGTWTVSSACLPPSAPGSPASGLAESGLPRSSRASAETRLTKISRSKVLLIIKENSNFLKRNTFLRHPSGWSIRNQIYVNCVPYVSRLYE